MYTKNAIIKNTNNTSTKSSKTNVIGIGDKGVYSVYYIMYSNIVVYYNAYDVLLHFNTNII
jgi:hypothetical protein